MNRLNRYIGLLIMALLFSCGGGDDGPPPNQAPGLIGTVQFPTANLLCIDNNITFDWNDATDAEDGNNVRYRITIARDRDLTDIVENRTVSTSQVTILLDRGTAFYWNVVTIDSEGLESQPSPTLAFFTMGIGETNSVPFTAELVAPADDADVPLGTVTLSWIGGDANPNDTLMYDVFFGTNPNPPLISENITDETIDIMASDATTTYYWRINTTDGSGSRSIGRVWQFTTN